MSAADYLIDSALVLLVLIQIKERFAFLIWITHGGGAATARFSAAHAITSKEAWTVALLAMAVAEVTGRSAVQAIRRHHHLTHAAPAALAHAA
jgi:hypothetical protein